MIEDSIPFGSSGYVWLLALLLFARGMDFLSTWMATPNLVLEGNPIAKKLGWKWGGLCNLILCFSFASWPLPAVIISTAGVLVAAHNFHSAWLMRSLGEEEYRRWFTQRIHETSLRLYLSCLLGETLLTGFIGAALIYFSSEKSVAYAIGCGIAAFAAIVLLYTFFGIWRIRRR